MKIIVVSDSHGNIANIKLVLGFAKRIKADGIIHCGDWDNLKSIEETLRSNIPLYAVLGNADIDEQITKKLKLKANKFDEKFLKIRLGERKIGVVHNLVLSSKLLAISYNVVFCGHRHFKSERIIDGVKVVSPGALHSIKPSFAVYDTGTNRVEFCDL
ncbi:MAG: YfcE family phosphodiesterase [Patescibacteria group bacterium]